MRLLPTIATSLSRRDLESPVILPRLDEVVIDGSVLMFTVVVSVLTGVLFGVVPALRQARTGSVDVLRQGGGSVASGFDVRGRSRAPGLLVACQVGVALVLCVGRALLIRSFVGLADVDPGYDAEGVVTFQLVVPMSIRQALGASRMRLIRQVVARRASRRPVLRQSRRHRILAAEPPGRAPGRRPRDPEQERLLLRLDRLRLERRDAQAVEASSPCTTRNRVLVS